MKDISIAKGKSGIPKMPVAPVSNNLIPFQFFYVALVSILLLVNILFENGVTNDIIKRAWGLNNFSYFPWWVQGIIFTFLYALATPSINNFFWLLAKKLIASRQERIMGKSRKVLWFSGISLIITLLFYLFRVKYDLLGDMNLRVSQSAEGNYIRDEYLTMYFMHHLVVFLQKLLHFSPHRTFVFASIGAGFFFSFLGLLIADLLFKDLPSVIIFFLFYISVGTVLVFCGYTEIYAIPAVSASLYMYTALLFLKKKTNIILPFFCLALAIALHMEQISLIPSFAFLALRKVKFIYTMDIKIMLLLFLVSFPLIYLLDAIFKMHIVMPILKDPTYPLFNTLFSISYIWELFNSQYISSGILLFLFVIIFFQGVKKQIRLDEYSRFFLITVLSIYSIIIVIGNKSRGSGDWDVCSFPAIYLSMFVAYVLLSQWKTIYSSKKLFYTISIALLLNIFSCLAWIGINSCQKSLDKIEDMLLTDPGLYYQASLPAESELSVLFYKCDAHEKAMKYYKLSYEKYSIINSHSVMRYFDMLMINKDTNQAISVLESTLVNHPFFFSGYDLLFKIYQKRKLYDSIYFKTKFFTESYKKNPQAVIGNQTGKKFLESCVVYLYKASLARNDTTTYNDALILMWQLQIKKPEN